MNHDEHKECLATVTELRKEWTKEKENRRRDSNKLAWALVCSIGLFVTYGMWVGTIQNEQQHTKDEILRLTTSVGALSASDSSTQAILAGMKAQLTGIEATLQEIKIQLR